MRVMGDDRVLMVYVNDDDDDLLKAYTSSLIRINKKSSPYTYVY